MDRKFVVFLIILLLMGCLSALIYFCDKFLCNRRSEYMDPHDERRSRRQRRSEMQKLLHHEKPLDCLEGQEPPGGDQQGQYCYEQNLRQVYCVEQETPEKKLSEFEQHLN
ncbi:uncharacterized protein [Macrobrachium rosenbergii]|uniref:uncharacterized protein n=1 Tax=Macrobrachium rosenbergii TaxID=79674 RepID=UPI0034D40186